MNSAVAVELRPPPLLAVGIAGHHHIAAESEPAVAQALDVLLQQLDRAFKAIVAAERAVFSAAPPTLRLVGTAAEGTGLLGARAAQALGAEFACILPFAAEEYADDFASPAARAAARALIAGAHSRFVLPGQREEGARAYERAHSVVLANIDLLVAVWNGSRADVRAGTGDIVQAAVASGIPVVVIDPAGPAQPKLLLGPGDDQLETPIAADLLRASPAVDVTSLLQQILAPPSAADKRRGLDDLYREEPGRTAARFEYRLLLQIFGVTRLRVPTAGATVAPADEHTTPAEDGAAVPRLGDLEQRTELIDRFGIRYAGMFRSSNTSAFLLIILAALLSAALSIHFPQVFGVWILGQMIVNMLVVADAAVSAKQRWHERWLDYRLIAEKLRCLPFLHPLGLGLGQATGSERTARTWADWYVRRSERGLPAPAGSLGAKDLERAARRLADVEIGGQVNYHRRAFRQLRILERRLAAVARLTLWATIVIAAGFALVTAYFAKTTIEPWQPLAMVLVFALPAATSAFLGVRAEADLVRLAERSATAAVALARLRRAIRAAEPTYDHVAVGAIRAAAIMSAELSDWRFVLERRRTRARSPSLGRPHRPRPR